MADRASILLLITILVLVTILLIFGLKYFSAARGRNVAVADENLYRELAGKAVASQTESAASLSAVRTGVADIETRLASIEKLLKDVQ